MCSSFGEGLTFVSVRIINHNDTIDMMTCKNKSFFIWCYDLTMDSSVCCFCVVVVDVTGASSGHKKIQKNEQIVTD